MHQGEQQAIRPWLYPTLAGRHVSGDSQHQCTGMPNWHMTPLLCALRDAQLRPPKKPPAWQGHVQQWGLRPGHFTPFFYPQNHPHLAMF